MSDWYYSLVGEHVVMDGVIPPRCVDRVSREDISGPLSPGQVAIRYVGPDRWPSKIQHYVRYIRPVLLPCGPLDVVVISPSVRGEQCNHSLYYGYTPRSLSVACWRAPFPSL